MTPMPSNEIGYTQPRMSDEVKPLVPPDAFLKKAEELAIVFDPGDIEKLGLYLALLLDANERFNLTAITDPNEAWLRHILDSLTLVPLILGLEESQPRRIIDVGSGGGLPGIPLAIVMPEIEFTLLEATGKKARFLDEVTSRIGLPNVRVICDRAETIGQDHKHHREQYDLVIARAVGRLPVLLELTVPLAKVGGFVLAMKGQKASEEIAEAKAAMHLLHCRVAETIATASGVIVVIEKARKTPRAYPRRPGEPKRAPLGG